MVPGSFIQFCIDSVFPERCIVCGAVIASADAALSAPAVAADPMALPGAAPLPLSNLPPSWPEAALEFLGTDFSVRLFPGVRVSARVLCAPCWLTLELAPSSSEEAADSGALGLEIVSPFYINNSLLAVVRYLKFSSGRRAVPPLAWWMAQAFRRRAVRGHRSVETDQVITAVPLHPARRRRRGYNQAALLASEAAGILDLPFTDALLERTRKTRPQSKLPAERRAENVRGAFAVRESARIEDKEIILVDDLVTTGETIRACVRALREADPKSIIVLTAGRARNVRSGDPLG